jgi:hypothetical protein
VNFISIFSGRKESFRKEKTVAVSCSAIPEG